MNLAIIGLFSVACFGQPMDGRWCEKPCDSSVVVHGTFNYPAPKTDRPSNKQKHTKPAQQRVTERAPQEPVIELPPPVVTSTVPVQRFWWLPSLWSWDFT
jgi:hypothetical protein